MKRTILSLAGIILFIAAIRIPLLGIPFERDEGEYAYTGQLMLQGIPPYQLAYSMKFPGTAAMYALVMAVFGETPAGIHLGVMCLTTLTALMLYWLGKKILDPTAGMVAATTYAVMAAAPDMLGLEGHATQFAALFVTGAVCLLWKARQEIHWLPIAASGFAFGLAVLMKQHAALIAVWALVVVAANSFSKAGFSASKRLAVVATFGGTAFGDIALVPAPFLKHPRGIRDIAEWYISTSESLGKAGGYAIQAHAAAFVSQFSGSLTTIIGLPLLEVVAALQELGWKFPDGASRD